MTTTTLDDNDFESLEGERLAGYQASRVPSGWTRTGLPAARRPLQQFGEPVPKIETTVAAPAFPAPMLSSTPPAPVSALIVEAATVAPRMLRTERRTEARWEFVVPVAATYASSDGTAIGSVVNISSSGLQIHMPEAPVDHDVELIVGDDQDCALLMANVVADRVDDVHDGFVWHVRVLQADDDWAGLLHRARVHPSW